jgi:hypothetical protein
MVEGKFAGASIENGSNHGLHVLHDFRRWNANYAQSLCRQPLVAASVGCGALPHVVRNAVDFHTKTGFCTIEVENIGTQWMLAAEFQPQWPSTEVVPKLHFGWR